MLAIRRFLTRFGMVWVVGLLLSSLMGCSPVGGAHSFRTIRGNAGISGVTLTASDLGVAGVAISKSDGTYTMSVNSSWSGTITPSLVGYTFSPTFRNVNSASDDSVDDFSAAAIHYTLYGNTGTCQRL